MLQNKYDLNKNIKFESWESNFSLVSYGLPHFCTEHGFFDKRNHLEGILANIPFRPFHFRRWESDWRSWVSGHSDFLLIDSLAVSGWRQSVRVEASWLTWCPEPSFPAGLAGLGVSSSSGHTDFHDWSCRRPSLLWHLLEPCMPEWPWAGE